MQRAVSALSLGLLIGMLGTLMSIIPAGTTWEEDTGLGLLFKLRGRQPPPSEVVIVAIKGETGRQLGLTEDIPDWPRSLYARLIDQLNQAGAAVIVFDVFFKHPQAAEADAALAAAIRRSGNVLLVGYLQREVVDVSDNRLSRVEIERLIPPVDKLAHAAVAVRPFVLPKVPIKVSRFWTYHGANQLASLPAAALEMYVDPSGTALLSLMQKIDSDTISIPPNLTGERLDERSVVQLRSLLRNDAKLRQALVQASTIDRLSDSERHTPPRLSALIGLYAGEDYPYLNFYGPPGTLATLPLHEVLMASAASLGELHGKAVFVGFAGSYQPKQKDGFYTVFSQSDGLDLSGVEIAATAFANLLQGTTITPLDPDKSSLLLIAYALLMVGLLYWMPGFKGILLGLLFAAGYFLLVYLLFAREQIWLPWLIPLFVQTPLAILLGLVLQYREAHQGRQTLRRAFGYYLPGDVVDRLAEDTGRTLALGESKYGVCLASDAQQYTRLAESLSPEALKQLLNHYYELLFTPVRAHGGSVSDVIGDAMMAIWSAPRAEQSIRRKACEAALQIQQALAQDSEAGLRTRIGLHAGELVLSHVGAVDHYEYRAVGDMVNTAARIENLNKTLGTRLLASEQVMAGLDGFITRELGVFHLEGKQKPLKIFEILGHDNPAVQPSDLLGRFAAALRAWQEGQWRSAIEQFDALLQDYPQDGPSKYYIELCRAREDSAVERLLNAKDKPQADRDDSSGN